MILTTDDGMGWVAIQVTASSRGSQCAQGWVDDESGAARPRPYGQGHCDQPQAWQGPSQSPLDWSAQGGGFHQLSQEWHTWPLLSPSSPTPRGSCRRFALGCLPQERGPGLQNGRHQL